MFFNSVSATALKGAVITILLVLVFPSASQAGAVSIAVDLRVNTLSLLGEDGQVLREYPVASGRRPGFTPLGEFRIVNAAKNPSWTYGGRTIPGGVPENPLGSRWLGLSVVSERGNRYGIHGTNDPESIGKYVSAGCIRLRNEDVEELFSFVSVGTKVVIGRSPEPPKVTEDPSPADPTGSVTFVGELTAEGGGR